MSTPTLPELQKQAADMGIVLEGKETKAEIMEKINAKNTTPPGQQTVQPGDSDKEEQVVTMKVSDIKKLIAQAIVESKETTPIKPKKVTEHQAHVWRLDGMWVVDFVDHNNDEYYKGKIHSYQKYNEQRREFEAWIELVLENDEGEKKTKELPLTRYVQNRHLVYCTIVKRHLIDKSYSIGEVEKKKENDKGDGYVGTGVMIDQAVEQYETVFELRLPTGRNIKLPEYVIA